MKTVVGIYSSFLVCARRRRRTKVKPLEDMEC